MVGISLANLSYLYLAHKPFWTWTGGQIASAAEIERLIETNISSEDAIRRIDQALTARDWAMAESYLALLEGRGEHLPEDLEAKADRLLSPLAKVVQSGFSGLKGFITGSGDDSAALAGAVTSDFLLVGDLRDLGIQGVAYARGEEVDETITLLSAAGVAATLAMVSASTGFAGTKSSLTLAKTTLKSSVLQPGLSRTVKRDLLLLAPKRYTRVNVSKSAKRHARKRLENYLTETGNLARQAGPDAALRLLPLAKNIDDIAVLSKVSSVTGKKTLAVSDRFGASILKLTRGTLKIGLEFGLSLLGLLASLFWICLQLGAQTAGKAVIRQSAFLFR